MTHDLLVTIRIVLKGTMTQLMHYPANQFIVGCWMNHLQDLKVFADTFSGFQSCRILYNITLPSCSHSVLRLCTAYTAGFFSVPTYEPVLVNLFSPIHSHDAHSIIQEYMVAHRPRSGQLAAFPLWTRATLGIWKQQCEEGRWMKRAY